MSVIHFKSPQDKDIVNFDKITKLISRSETNKFFISNWDSDKCTNYLYSVYENAFSESLSDIDHYNSSEDNQCQSIISQYINQQYNMNLSKSQIIIGNSATSLICFYILLLTSLGTKRFLGFSPIYYSFLDAIKIGNADIIIYQSSSLDNYWNYDEVEQLIKTNKIDAIIITDPIFCFGISIGHSRIKDLIDLALKYNCYVIADFTREGNNWNTNNDEKIINNTIKLFDGLKKFAVFYSPCKKVFANGIKTGLLLVSDENIDYIYSLQDTFIGSISTIQIKFLSLLFKNECQEYISNQIFQNKKLIISNYDKISSLLLDANINLIKPKYGNFTVAQIKKRGLSDQDCFKMLLNKFDLITLPLSLYHYYDDENYLFRINLTLEKESLLNAVIRLMEL